MAKIFMPQASIEERLIMLKNNADKIEETTYDRELTLEELDAKREAFVDNSIKVSQLEDDLDGIKKSFKSQIDPIKLLNKTLQHEVKTKKSTVKGVLFHMAHHDEGMMEFYDENGELISTRRLRPEEKQARLFIIDKKVANDE
jgi:hypothetical protein